MNNWKIYKNGNVFTKINLADGTKIRETNDDEFKPAFAENCDVKITDVCNGGCRWCYEGCTPNGRHADIMNAKFIDTLHPFTELAINGNDLSHPDLIPFLHKLKDKKVITNMTVNQKHFESNLTLIDNLIADKLIYGLGVSLVNPTNSFIANIKKYPNAVIHVINGILSPSDVDALSNKGLRILILGYKNLRRGSDWLAEDHENIVVKQMWLKENLSDIINKFEVLSFDNLAIEQLDVKRLLTQEEWDEFFMGSDGEFTYYIDMVDKKFSRDSTAPFDKRYDLLDSVDDMFNVIKSER